MVKMEPIFWPELIGVEPPPPQLAKAKVERSETNTPRTLKVRIADLLHQEFRLLPKAEHPFSALYVKHIPPEIVALFCRSRQPHEKIPGNLAVHCPPLADWPDSI